MNLFNNRCLKIKGKKSLIPIIQGGMGVGISLSGLASAVAEEGGIGVIASAGIGINEPDYETNFKEANIRALRSEIKKAREKTRGLIGVNIMIALSDYENLLRTSIEEEADYVFLSAGLPLKVPSIINEEQYKSTKTGFIPVISSARTASVIIKSWSRSGVCPDAFVIEGPKAGGHLGYRPEDLDAPEFSVESTLKDVLEVTKDYESKTGVKIPVITGGGVFSGEDIYKFLCLGADGVQMATRFVATEECDAGDEFKQAYIDAKEEDLTIIKSPVGLPGRALKNTFLKNIELGKLKPFSCPWKCLATCDFKSAPYCIAKALNNAKRGRLDLGFAFAGVNVYKIKEIVSVKELVETLVEEFNRCVQQYKVEFA